MQRFSSETKQPRIALAVLLVGGRYVMQLRDDKSGISTPGVWGLFGGAIEDGEEPQIALLREVREELCIELHDFHFLWSVEHFGDFPGGPARYWLFEADITNLWGRHRLMEGQAVQHFAFDELRDFEIASFARDVIEWHHNGEVPLKRVRCTED